VCFALEELENHDRREDAMSESITERRDGLAARLSSTLLRQIERIKSAVFKCGQPRRMVLVEALELGNRRQLFLVACDEQRFLVGAGRDRIGTMVAFPETSLKSATDAAPSEIGTTPVVAARGSERGRGLELVRRDSFACASTGDKAFEAGKTQ
jgi:hypothetical protein